MANQYLWPELPYDKFQSTGHLLHMACQMLGKLKLLTPFEPHWANVPLWVTSVGLTTGPIPYEHGTFTVDIDLIHHHIICLTSLGKRVRIELKPMSVAELAADFLTSLKSLDINTTINMMPQEIAHPIAFNEDTNQCSYDGKLANAWWRIVANTYQIMQRYHAKFTGITPAIGLMWGTFDLRDARYINKKIPPTGVNAGYLRRNAMDVAQVEAGWWSGDERYEKPAYYSFIYPQPNSIEQARVQPEKAHWHPTLGEFILDYDDVRTSKNPENDLLAFFESTYQVEAKLANWDEHLIGPGTPT